MKKKPSIIMAGVTAFAVALPTLFFPPAYAAEGDVVLSNGCTVVAEPTEENHTVCEDTSFTNLDDLTGLDFSYAELSGSDFTSTTTGLDEVNFSNADLTDVNFNITESSNLDFTNANLDGTLLPLDNQHVKLPNVDLSKLSTAQFETGKSLTISNGELDGLEVSSGSLGNGALVIRDSEMKGSDLSNVVFNGPVEIRDTDLADLNISGAKFNGVSTSFRGSTANNSDFSNIEITSNKTDFGGFKSDSTDFSNSSVNSSDSFLSINFGGAVITSSKFEDINWTAPEISFGGADLTGSSFKNSHIESTYHDFGGFKTDFGGSNLTNVDFSNASVSAGLDSWSILSFGGSILTNTDFRNTVFTGTNITLSTTLDHSGLKLSGATFNNGTNGHYWYRATEIQAMDLSGIDFTDITFNGAVRFNSTIFDNADFTGTVFNSIVEANAISAVHTDFSNVVFNAPIALSGAWLVSSQLQNVQFEMPDKEENIYSGAIFAHANLEGQTLVLNDSGYIFTDANLKNATLNFFDSTLR